MKAKANRILWGVVLIAVGVLLGINALDLLEFNLFFDGWWTLFILVPSVIGLLTDDNKWGAFIGLLFGVFFLLCAQGVLSYDLLWKLALPIVAVLVGLSLLFGKRKKAPEPNEAQPASRSYTSADHSRCVAVFSGQEMRCDGRPFRGADVSAVFGGVDVFASTSIITEDCTLNVAAVFGGVDVYLPAGVNVKVTSHGLFGGVDNLRQVPPIEGAPTVTVNAVAVFGGVDIK